MSHQIGRVEKERDWKIRTTPLTNNCITTVRWAPSSAVTHSNCLTYGRYDWIMMSCLHTIRRQPGRFPLNSSTYGWYDWMQFKLRHNASMPCLLWTVRVRAATRSNRLIPVLKWQCTTMSINALPADTQKERTGPDKNGSCQWRQGVLCVSLFLRQPVVHNSRPPKRPYQQLRLASFAQLRRSNLHTSKIRQ